jgi:hypothetical protein
MTNTKVEDRLLLYCVCVGNHQANQVKIRKILTEQPIDWSYIIQQALQHGIIIFLHQNLMSTCPDQVPEDIVKQFKNWIQNITINNLRVTRELLNIVDFLNHSNTRVIHFKGPVIAKTVYENYCARQFYDLDFLVSDKDYAKVILLMTRTAGYQKFDRNWHFLNPKQEENYILNEPEYSLVKKNIIVDLHQKLIKPDFFVKSFFDFESLWKRTQPTTLSGRSLMTLCPEDLLLYLCIHGAIERWRSLKWIRDIAMLVAHHTIDWQKILESAQAANCERMFYVALILARDLLDISLPKIVTEKLVHQKEISQTLADRLSKKIFEVDRSYKIYPHYPHWLDDFFYLKIMDRIEDRLNATFRFRLRTLKFKFEPTSQDLNFIKLPVSLYFLYYFIRPLRLFRLSKRTGSH